MNRKLYVYMLSRAILIIISVTLLASCTGKCGADNLDSTTTPISIDNSDSSAHHQEISDSPTVNEKENNNDSVDTNQSSTQTQDIVNETISYIPEIPVEGMSVFEMNNTKLGPYDERSEKKIAYFSQAKHECYDYWWKNAKGNVYFAASVIDGKVVGVSKYFTQFWDGDTYNGTKLYGH